MIPPEALAEWSRSCLVVPPGHAKAGEPLGLPDLRRPVPSRRHAAGSPGSVADVREKERQERRPGRVDAWVSWPRMGRYVVKGSGPVWRRYRERRRASCGRRWKPLPWRAVLRISGSGRFPGVRCPGGASVDFLSCRPDGWTRFSGYDVALADEMGLYPEKGRALVAGLLSSTSAKDGRLIAISVMGDSPLTAELVQRRDDPSVVVHAYHAPAGCALDDEAAWRAANPGLGTIKSLSYMRDMARRAAALPSEQSSFRAFDLNQTGSPVADAVVALSVWEAVERQPKPERSGPCFVGV